jgi:hypothetical protein
MMTDKEFSSIPRQTFLLSCFPTNTLFDLEKFEDCIEIVRNYSIDMNKSKMVGLVSDVNHG